VKNLFAGYRAARIDRDAVLSHLSRPAFHRLRLERFPRGIDSAHIDVALDPTLVDAAMAMVHAILNEDVQRYFWQQPPKAPDQDAIEVFRRCYSENTRLVLRECRARARPEEIQLFQLAVLRLLISLVDDRLARLRQELEDARAQPARQHSGQSLELHDKVVILARNEQSIRYRALHDVLRVFMRLEDSSLRKMRKTVMGMSWPVSRDMLANPLVLLCGMGASEDFFNYYPHILRDDADASALNRLLFETFAEWLPDEVGLPGESSPGDEAGGSPGCFGLRGHAGDSETLSPADRSG